MPILVFSMPDIIQALKMQIQTNNCKIALEEVTVEDVELANASLAFRHKITSKQIRQPHPTRQANLRNKFVTKEQTPKINLITKIKHKIKIQTLNIEKRIRYLTFEITLLRGL